MMTMSNKEEKDAAKMGCAIALLLMPMIPAMIMCFLAGKGAIFVLLAGTVICGLLIASTLKNWMG